MLDEMERNLYHSDADFVSAVSGGRGRLHYGSLVLGVLLALAGLAVIIAGVVSHLLIVGIVGFAVMFVGVLLATRRSRKAAYQTRAARKASRPAARGSFMDRMNDRWDNREERD